MRSAVNPRCFCEQRECICTPEIIAQVENIMNDEGRGGSTLNRTGVAASVDIVSTPRVAADEIADVVFRVTHQVLTVEDREEIACIVTQSQEPLIQALAQIGFRCDEEGDQVGRRWAADAIAVARGRK